MKRFILFGLAAFLLSQSIAVGQSLAKYQWQLFEMPTKPSLRGIFAVSAQTVWVSGSNGSYFYTTDGGQSWTTGKVPNADSLDFRDIEVLPNGRVILLACGPGEKSQIFISDDNGTNWVNVFISPFDEGFFCAMAFWDERQGIAFSDPVNNRFKLMITKDGGTTWSQLIPEDMPAANPGEYAFAASGTCITVASQRHVWFGTGGSTARVFYSHNNGVTWSVVPTPMQQGHPSQGIFSIAFRDSLTGFASGGDYQAPQKTGNTLLTTNDGGKHWDVVADSAVGYRSCIATFQTEFTNGWIAMGKNGWSISEDNGNTWQHFPTPGFYTVSISRNTVWAAGANGRIGKLQLMAHE